MKFFPFTLMPLPLALLVVGTTSETALPVPSEIRRSLQASDCYENSCGDKHDDIMLALVNRFGEENCNPSIMSFLDAEGSSGAEVQLRCEYSVPYWFSAYVEYKALNCDSDDSSFYPYYLEASYATPPGSSLESSDLKTSCVSDNGIYSAIFSQWVDEDDAPPIPSGAPMAQLQSDAPYSESPSLEAPDIDLKMPSSDAPHSKFSSYVNSAFQCFEGLLVIVVFYAW